MELYERSDLLRDKINAQLAPFFVGDYRTTRSQDLLSQGEPSPDEWVGSGS